MSSRLKLKKLKREMELVRNDCSRLEEEAKYEKRRCYRLLQENIQEIGAFAELYPCETMREAAICLDYNVRKVTDAIVRKYSKQLEEFVRNQLVTKYALNSFSTIDNDKILFVPAKHRDHRLGRCGFCYGVIIIRVYNKVLSSHSYNNASLRVLVGVATVDPYTA